MNQSTDWLGDEELDPPAEITEADWDRYARLKIARDKIDLELKDLQTKLLTQGDEWKHTTPYGTISAFKRTFISYSGGCKEKIKELQEQDVARGLATAREATIIKYTKPSNL